MGSGVSTNGTYDIDDPRDVSLQLINIISEEYQVEFIRTNTTLKKLISYNDDELNDLIDSIQSSIKINVINKINTLKDNNANRLSGSIEALDRSCTDDDVEDRFIVSIDLEACHHLGLITLAKLNFCCSRKNLNILLESFLYFNLLL
jgi:hypothetical protein